MFVAPWRKTWTYVRDVHDVTTVRAHWPHADSSTLHILSCVLYLIKPMRPVLYGFSLQLTTDQIDHQYVLAL